MAAKARVPFHGHPRADAILQTCNNVLFYVHTDVLSMASPFFDQLFSLPQPANIPDATSGGNTLPIIPISEDSATVDHLLRLCYPIPRPPPLTNIGTVAKVLEAAMKYELVEAVTSMKKIFHSLISTSPLDAYAIACRLKLETEASMAARAHPFQLTLVGRSYSDAMKNLPAGCYFRLLRYLQGETFTPFCEPLPSPRSLHQSQPDANDSALASPEVLLQYPADVILKSSDGILIPTHRLLLALSGATINIDQTHQSDSSGVPIVEITHSGAVLHRLLRMCHPGGSYQDSETFEEARLVYDAATKLGMLKIADIARRNSEVLRERAPLTAYLVSVRRGWETDAKAALSRALCGPLWSADAYVPEMEVTSAKVLRDLYSYHYQRREPPQACMLDLPRLLQVSSFACLSPPSCVCGSDYPTRSTFARTEISYVWPPHSLTRCPRFPLTPPPLLRVANPSPRFSFGGQPDQYSSARLLSSSKSPFPHVGSSISSYYGRTSLLGVHILLHLSVEFPFYTVPIHAEVVARDVHQTCPPRFPLSPVFFLSSIMTTKAAAPFNGHRADVILRTTDNVDFHAHMNMLCVASPFFDQMFSLPQPPVIAQDGTSSPVPTIPLSEDSQTMDHLLRLCYPVAKPQPLKKLELVAKVLVAAMKYEFEEATVLMKTSFHSLIKSSPLEAYAISCRLKLEKEASLSAKAWKEKLKVDGAL
ncbi:hypothetical protein BXZ70DRAFT_993107, partial [Cristinia sonorae]